VQEGIKWLWYKLSRHLPHVLSQLPRHLQESFPALLTARAAIDKGLMSLMRTCFATGLGPDPFASLLGEMCHLDHAHRELIYLSALTVATESVTLHHEPFSAFWGQELLCWHSAIQALLQGSVCRLDACTSAIF